MNAERLHAILKAVKEELEQTNLITHLEELVSTLQNVINQPQEPHQQAL